MELNIPLISHHDSWISIDPILGCPAACSYCYLQPLGLTGSKPEIRISPIDMCMKLRELFNMEETSGVWGTYQWEIPICIGNYTDMCMSDLGRNYLVEYLKLHSPILKPHPLVIVTKGKLSKGFIQKLDSFGHPVLFFLSQSFASLKIPDIEKGGISSPTHTLQNIELIGATKNIKALHFWRPLTTETIPDENFLTQYIRQMKAAGSLASVAIGLKGGTFLKTMELKNKSLVENENLPLGGEFFPPDLENYVLNFGFELDYPIYRQTSCAIAMAMNKIEALGTWRARTRIEKCEPCFCPGSQRIKCDYAFINDKIPSRDFLLTLSASLGGIKVSWDPVREGIRIETILDQDVHTKLTHLTGHLIIPLEIKKKRAWIGLGWKDSKLNS